MKKTIYECLKCNKKLEVIVSDKGIIKDEVGYHSHANDYGWQSKNPTRFNVLEVIEN